MKNSELKRSPTRHDGQEVKTGTAEAIMKQAGLK